MKTDRSWGAVVVDSRGKYLLVHHASGKHWDHPKGHAEKNETPTETAKREIREEAGIEAELINGFQMETGWVLPDGRPKKVVYFLARHAGNCPAEGPEDEILETVWLDYNEARERISYESGKLVLDGAKQYLEEHLSGAGTDDEIARYFQ